MRKKRYTAEQIIAELREAEVALSQAPSLPDQLMLVGHGNWSPAGNGPRFPEAKRLRIKLETKWRTKRPASTSRVQTRV